MSQPQLPKIKIKSSQSAFTPAFNSQSQGHHYMPLSLRSSPSHEEPESHSTITEDLHNLVDDIATPSGVKRKLKDIISKIPKIEQETPLVNQKCVRPSSSPVSTLSSSASQVSPRPLEVAFRDWVSGDVFINENGRKLTGSTVRCFADISAAGYSMSVTGSPQIFNRGTPATQNPTETFEMMNKLMMFSLCYVNVQELEFDIDKIREMDDSLMKPSERLFLSVCCSVFANFSFVRDLDLAKLVKFFSSLYGMYINTNPYHNFLHAVDSLQMLSLFFRDPCVNFCLTDEEILLSLLSVLALDVVHIGIHNSSLSAMDHNIVKIFGPTTTVEHSSLLVFFRVLFREENFFMLPLFSDEGPDMERITTLVREKISSIVFKTSVSQRSSLLRTLECIGDQGTIFHRDVIPLLSALVVLGSNGFMFRQRSQCLRFGYSLRLEFIRESQEMARRRLFFFIPNGLLNNMGVFAADYAIAVVKPIVDRVWTLVPVDLRDNFLRNCEAVEGDELKHVIKTKASSSSDGQGSTGSGISASHAFSPFPSVVSPWEDNMTKVIEILQNASTFATSVNRKVSKMAILNATPPRRASTMEFGWSPSGLSDDRRSEGENSIVAGNGGSNAVAEDNQGSFCSSTSSRVCKPEHCFLFIQLYDRYEMENRTLDEFIGQLIFLAMQLDPAYLSTESRSFFLSKNISESLKYLELGKYILANEEAPSTAEHLVGGRSRPSTPIHETASLIVQLLDMYARREAQKGNTESEHFEGIDYDNGPVGSVFCQSTSDPPENSGRKTPPPSARKRGDTPTFRTLNSPQHSLSDPSLFSKAKRSM